MDMDHDDTHLIHILAYTSEDVVTLVIPKSMIIRESPSPRKNGPGPANWPPKSPHQALLSSPSGRKRLQCAARPHTSPSPSKRRRLADGDVVADDQSDSDEDEDEETVQLKLKAIEARLKLKKLQKAKRKTDELFDEGASTRKRRLDHGSSEFARPPRVEVPLSPKPQRANILPPQSPKRVLLGIDKGLRANQVSLKKSLLAANASSTVPTTSSNASRNNHKSFGARLVESRSQEVSRQEKRERIESNRSEGFGLTRASTTKHTAHDKPEARPISPTNARQRQSTEINAKSANSSGRPTLEKPSRNEAVDKQDDESEGVESFSGFKLSKQKINNPTLEAALANKTLISIPKLLKTVTAPNYDPPDVEDDYVVLGIIASKSLPRNHIAKHQTKSNADPDDDSVLPPRSKFMAIRLTDLKWEVDLFLFDTAFDRFWKLTVGTVIAILNPGIMPPKPHMRDTGQFSLKVASSEDTVLEIGMSEDLGFCKSIKKDGKECTQWIDGRKTEYCDFHVNLRVEKAKAGRMEINGMTSIGMFGNNPRNSGRGGRHGGQGRGRGHTNSGRGRGDGLKREGAYFDRSIGETAYVIPKEFGRVVNTSRMLDAEDYVQGGLSKAERSRRRLADQEKERNLAKALGSQGNGLGSEYMRFKRGDKDSRRPEGDQERDEEPADAASLGLIGSNAHAVKLSPSKKGRRVGHAATSEPMGWSGAFKRGLLSPSRKENQHASPNVSRFPHDVKTQEKDTSPSKQARFLIKEKGIRIPGRESNGNDARNAVFDDDDDLDIV